jgi:chlorite dismutase
MSTDAALCHFAAFRFLPSWWEANAEARESVVRETIADLRKTLPRVEFYRVFPTRHDADLLIWTAAGAEDPTTVTDHLRHLGDPLNRWRPWAEPVRTLWGLTRPSPYTKRPSSRTIDPLDGTRRPALVIYPFSKTADWYLLDADRRKELMGEHIRVGREYPEVDQLLLYSYGLQDQEFVVVYEMDDLARFSELVGALRATEVRRYTLLDTPVWTALHIPTQRLTSAW